MHVVLPSGTYTISRHILAVLILLNTTLGVSVTWLMKTHQRINGGIRFPMGVGVTKWLAWLPASRWSWVRSHIKADLKNEPGLPGQPSQYLLKLRPPRWQGNRLISFVLALGYFLIIFYFTIQKRYVHLLRALVFWIIWTQKFYI